MKSASDSKPVLIALSGPLNGGRWVIQKETILGRGDSCDIAIPDRKISRFHAQISMESDFVLLKDLDSKNGTHHNGKLINTSVRLNDGDIIQIALAQKFTYLSSDATIPLEFAMTDLLETPDLLLKLEKKSRKVWIREEELLPPLSAAQFSLLEFLYKSEGRVVSRENLVKTIWGESESYGVSDQALDALVRRLRDRLAKLGKNHAFVVTVRGHGLRLENPQAFPKKS